MQIQYKCASNLCFSSMDGVCCNAKTCLPYATTTEADKVTCSEATECKEAIKCQADSFACPTGNAWLQMRIKRFVHLDDVTLIIKPVNSV